MSELVDFVTPRLQMPLDVDQPFIAGYEYDAPNIEKRWFRLFITTKRLMSLAVKSKHILADATYNHDAISCLRKRLPLKQCLQEMFNLVSKWSKKHSKVSVIESVGEMT